MNTKLTQCEDNCKRCKQPNEWVEYGRKEPENAYIVERDAPFAFDSYCSAICQALDLRHKLARMGKFNPLTGAITI